MTTEKLNEKMVLVTINFRKTTGEVSLTPDDFGGDVSSLPPGTLGTKLLINKNRLTGFERLKRSAVELLKYNGVEFHGSNSVLIPDSNYPAVKSELEGIIQKYQSETSDFLSKWDSYCEEYIAANPQFETVLREARPSVNKVRESFVSDYLGNENYPVAG